MPRTRIVLNRKPIAEQRRGGLVRKRFSFDPKVLEREVQVETFRASGPGGQNLHKTESAVRMTHAPSGVVVTASDTRSQTRNRAIALARLVVRLRRLNVVPKTRTPTRPTSSSVRRRLEQKRRQADAKGLRGRVHSHD